MEDLNDETLDPEKIKNDILNTSSQAIKRIEEYESKNRVKDYRTDLDTFDQLFSGLQTNEANELLKQLNVWGEGKTKAIDTFERHALVTIEESLEAINEDINHSIPVTQKDMSIFNNYLSQQKSEISRICDGIVDATHALPGNIEEGICVPNLQVHSNNCDINSFNIDTNKQYSGVQDLKRNQELFLEQLKQLKMNLESLHQDIEISRGKNEQLDNEKKRLQQASEDIQLYLNNILLKKQELEIQHKMDIEKLKDQIALKRKMKEVAIDSKLDKEEDKKGILMEESQKTNEKTIKLEYQNTFSHTVEPYHFDTCEFFKKLQKRLTVQEEPAEEKVEVVLRDTEVFDSDYKLNSVIEKYTNVPSEIVSFMIKRQEELASFDSDVSHQTKQSQHPLPDPNIQNIKPENSIESNGDDDFELDTDRTVVLTLSFKLSSGESMDYGVLQPITVKIMRNGYRLLFRDNDDAIILEAKTIYRNKEGADVVVPTTNPIRIKSAFTEPFLEKCKSYVTMHKSHNPCL